MSLLNGTNGANTISGTSGADIIQGNGGNDALYGKGGNDTYIFNLGDGIDSIYESSGTDMIEFGVGIDAGDVQFTKSGNDFVISINGASDILNIKNYFSGTAKRVETIRFYGDAYTNVSSHVDTVTITGNGTSEKLYGTTANEYFIGDNGDDTLYGYGGDDTYSYDVGDGNDTVIDTGDTDTIEFTNINNSEVTYKRDGYAIYANSSTKNDIYMTVSSGGSIRLPNYYSDTDSRIEELIFADDSGAFEDNIGAKGVGIIDMNNHNLLKGTSDNDAILGGTGNDTIYGLAGDDMYYYRTGDGNDRIIDTAGTDTINFGNSYNVDVLTFVKSASDLIITTADASTITIANWFSDDAKKIEYLVDTISGVNVLGVSEILAKAAVDAGAGSATITGTNLGEGLDSGAGNDTILGRAGNDTYVYNYTPTYQNVSGDGQDVIYDTSGNDTLYIGGGTILQSNLAFARSNDKRDLIVQLKSNGSLPGQTVLDTNNSITLEDWFVSSDKRIENIIPKDAGVTLDKYDIFLQGGLTVAGTAGVTDYIDSVDGTTEYADFIDLTSGQDTLLGGAGDDTYYYSSGDGLNRIIDTSGNDTILFSSTFSSANFKYSRYGNDLKVWHTSQGTYMIVQDWFTNTSNRIENIEFENGDPSLHLADILANLGTSGNNSDELITGNSGNNDISSSGGNDTILGLAGNDVIIADAGNDSILGGAGDDNYHFYTGDGQDTIFDSSGNDTLLMADINSSAVSWAKVGNNLEITGTGTDKVTILNYFSGINNKIETISFSNESWETGDVISHFATDSANMLKTSDIGDSIIGKGGNDTIYGYGGNDTYYIDSGDGKDYIYESAGEDEIKFGYDYDYNTVSATKSGSNLVVDYLNMLGQATGDGAVVKNYFSSANSAIETIQTTSSGIIATNRWITTANMNVGTSGNNNFFGGTEDNFYFGNSGNDTIYDIGGDDSYYIKAGNSYITDEGGNDQYHYYKGVGNDTISISGSGYDEFIFYNVNPTLPGGLSYSISDFDLKITLSSNNTLTFKNWYTDTSNRINNFKFYYGTDGSDTMSYDSSVVTTSAIHMEEGTSGGEELGNASYNDCIMAGAGNDTIHGANGNDRSYDKDGDELYQFASTGDGHDTIVDLRGNDTISFTTGSFSDLDFIRTGNDLIIDYADDNSDITVKNWFLSTNNQIEDIKINTTYYEVGTKLFAGTTGKDVLTGTDSAERFYAQAGNDIITCNGGNDTIDGGSGNDVYKFGLGDDVDIINDSAGTDRIDFKSDVSKAKIAVFKSGSDLVIDYGTNAGNDKVTVLSNTVEKLKLSNGKYMSLADINHVINQMSTYASAHSINFNSISDVKASQDLMNIIISHWHS